MTFDDLMRAYDAGGQRALRDMGVPPEIIDKFEEIEVVKGQIESLLGHDPHGELDQMQAHLGSLEQDFGRQLRREDQEVEELKRRAGIL